MLAVGIGEVMLGFRALQGESGERFRAQCRELRGKIAERRKVADGGV